MIVITSDIFVIHLNFPLSTYEQFSDRENNTMSPEYVEMEVDQNQNHQVPISIDPDPQPGCLKQVSSTFEQTPEGNGFDYVVEIKHSEKVCFGSTITRSTAPIGKHLSPFQKRISPEIFKPGPGSYHNEVYSSALYPLMNKVQSKRGVGPLASRDERFKEKIIRTPSPGRYNVIPKGEFKESKAPFGVAAAITRQRHNNIPGPATYNTRKIKKCRRTKLSDNFGKPNMIYAIETTCVSVPIDTCQKCNKLCTGDYWHLDYSEFLCQLCWMEERSVPELYTKEVLKTMKKIRNCSFMHNHQGTDAAIITMPLNTVKKKVRIENYLDLYLEC